MAKVWNDILVDDDGDQVFENGDYKVGNAIDQDVDTILGLSPGQWASDPVMGPSLIRMMKSSLPVDRIRKAIKLNLKRDSKNVRTMRIVKGIIKLDCEQQ